MDKNEALQLLKNLENARLALEHFLDEHKDESLDIDEAYELVSSDICTTIEEVQSMLDLSDEVL